MVRQLFQQLYYITHVENLPSIFNHGILSHRRIVDDRVQFTPIYDASIVSNRGQKTTPDGNTLWDFANLYFQPRNAMLYSSSQGEIGRRDLYLDCSPRHRESIRSYRVERQRC